MDAGQGPCVKAVMTDLPELERAFLKAATTLAVRFAPAFPQVFRGLSSARGGRSLTAWPLHEPP